MLAHFEQPFRESRGVEDLSRSERASGASVLLPLYPAMTDEELEHVVRTLWSPDLLNHGAESSANDAVVAG
jgi:dTDP-4-amino-4,6-dideoxygalactose transaminase